MNTPPPPLTPTDESELTLLSTLFFFYGAFVGLLALLVGAMAFVPQVLMHASPKPIAQEGWFVGGVFTAMFLFFAVFLLAKTVVVMMAARCFANRTNYALCMVGACVSLMNIPLGTGLGVFALIVLQRPAVKARFSYPA